MDLCFTLIPGCLIDTTARRSGMCELRPLQACDCTLIHLEFTWRADERCRFILTPELEELTSWRALQVYSYSTARRGDERCRFILTPELEEVTSAAGLFLRQNWRADERCKFVLTPELEELTSWRALQVYSYSRARRADELCRFILTPELEEVTSDAGLFLLQS
jgi:hypothetical protein